MKTETLAVATVRSGPMTPTEIHLLESCEYTIKHGMETFLEVGQAFLTIRQRRLYRRDYDNFETYCRHRWQMTPRRAQQLAASASVVNNLRALGPGNEPKGNGDDRPAETGTVDSARANHGSPAYEFPAPTSERQVRPLAGLEPEAQREAWRTAVKAAGQGKQPTGKDVQAAVEATGNGRWPKPNEHGVYSEKGSEALRFSHRAVAAIIRVLQIGPTEWVSSLEHEWQRPFSQSSEGLTADHSYRSRELAILEKVGVLRTAAGAVLIDRQRPADVRAGARKLIDWTCRFAPMEPPPAKQKATEATETQRPKTAMTAVQRAEAKAAIRGLGQAQAIMQGIKMQIAKAGLLNWSQAGFGAGSQAGYQCDKVLDHLSCLHGLLRRLLEFAPAARDVKPKAMERRARRSRVLSLAARARWARAKASGRNRL